LSAHRDVLVKEAQKMESSVTTESSVPSSPRQVVGPDGETRTISDRTALRVWVAAGGRCTMCNRRLVDDAYTGADVSIGQLAHIVGWKKAEGSPRGLDPLPVADRNDEPNLMLLCYDQHRVIDNRSMWEVFDADTLRAMKRRHEQRIAELTAIADDDKTTVLRVIGSIRGASVSASPQTVAKALLTDGRFPDYALLGADELEVDLRPVPSENPAGTAYWEAGRDMIVDRLRLLRAKVDRETVRHISVFAFGRIPMLVTLGSMLDDTIPTAVYAKRRDEDEGWGWKPGAATVDFEFSELRAGSDPLKVAVVFSVSGSVDLNRLPETVDGTVTIYEVRPVGAIPSPDVLATAEALANFTRGWRDLLAHTEATHPGLDTVDVFPAVPVTAAVQLGRARMRDVHPALRVYDRTADGGYEFALEIAR
jgi:hypothetical protein